jgi:hypothetical protein
MRLILLLLPITFFTKADMDYVCDVTIGEGYLENVYSIRDYIGKNCERNNILVLSGMNKYDVAPPDSDVPIFASTWFPSLIARYCRFDRNINDDLVVFDDGGEIRQISCVLYDNEARMNIK